jgi:hypothetical protein
MSEFPSLGHSCSFLWFSFCLSIIGLFPVRYGRVFAVLWRMGLDKTG